MSHYSMPYARRQKTHKYYNVSLILRTESHIVISTDARGTTFCYLATYSRKDNGGEEGDRGWNFNRLIVISSPFKHDLMVGVSLRYRTSFGWGGGWKLNQQKSMLSWVTVTHYERWTGWSGELHLVKKYFACMASEGTLPCSKRPIIFTHPETDKQNVYTTTKLPSSLTSSLILSCFYAYVYTSVTFL